MAGCLHILTGLVMCVTFESVFTSKQKINITLKCETENLDDLSLGIGSRDPSTLHF